MIELGQLEAKHADFEKRKATVVVASLENQETARLTQADFPHLVVVADAEHKLADALAVIQTGAGLGGSDTNAPTTVLVDGNGIVRWVFRPDNFFRRLSPDEVLQALDEHVAR